MFDLNPIDVLKQRRLKTIPPHFSKIAISDNEIFEGVEEWVKTKLKGRYCLAKQPGIDKSGNLRSTHYLGFEDQSRGQSFQQAQRLLRSCG